MDLKIRRKIFLIKPEKISIKESITNIFSGYFNPIPIFSRETY